MYFESRVSRIKNISHKTREEQAKEILNLSICQAVRIGNVIWVNDENPSGTGVLECALLLVVEDEYFQFESITVGWCSDLKIEGFLRDYEDESKIKETYGLTKVAFNQEEKETWFDCGCCGSGFKSTIQKQRKYDQDAGYGICNSCA